MEDIRIEEGFRLDSDSKVEWYLGKLADLKARQERIKAQSKLLMDQVQTDINSLEYRFGSELRAYCETRMENRKSVAFFNGTVQFRTVPQGIKIEDESAFMEVARIDDRLADLIITQEVLDKKKATDRIKELLEESGELIAGTAIVPARESMSISFGKKSEE